MNFKLTGQQENFIEKCFINDLSMVKTLVKYKVDYTVSEYWGIRIAASKGYADLLVYLLTLNPDREKLADSYILSMAATSGNMNTTKTLIEDGDFYQNDSSALQWTATKGDVEMMELLLEYCKCFDGVIVSAIKAGKLKMVEYLLDNSIDEYDKNFKLAFNNAISYRKKEVADFLVQGGYFCAENVDSDIWDKYLKLQ